jgi:diguanylate cyclase (GGDEF)-like protein
MNPRGARQRMVNQSRASGRIFERDQDRLAIADAILARSHEAVALTDASGRIVDANDLCLRQVERPLDEIRNRTLELLIDRVMHPDGVSGMLNAAGENNGWKGEILCRTRSGEAVPGWAKATVLRDDAGAITHFLVFWSDVSELKAREAESNARARNDPLTGLPDRRVIEDRLLHSLLRIQRSGDRTGVLFIDLDRFKEVNDHYGHAAGDSVVKSVASRLAGSVRSADTVGRLGGDEFIVLLESVADIDAARAVAEQLVATIAEPLLLGGSDSRLSASIGVAVAPDHATDAQDLLAAADHAMYAAKRAGGDCVQAYDQDIERATRESDRLRQALGQAVIDRDFELEYQPQVRLSDGRIVGAEALVRWNHPELGRIPAGQFISLAEDSGLILELGNWVIRQACEQMVDWDRQGLQLDLISVNLSTRQAMLGPLDAELRGILDQTGLLPNRLQLEITESFVMDYASRHARAIGRIRSMGVNFAIDNFGTGYSSLDQLRSLNVRDMKIDRYFVAALGSGDIPGNRAVLQAMIAVAGTLGLRAVAEGIETRKQVESLRALGCDEGQGDYFSRPLRPDELADLMDRDDSLIRDLNSA